MIRSLSIQGILKMIINYNVLHIASHVCNLMMKSRVFPARISFERHSNVDTASLFTSHLWQCYHESPIIWSENNTLKDMKSERTRWRDRETSIRRESAIIVLLSLSFTFSSNLQHVLLRSFWQRENLLPLFLLLLRLTSDYISKIERGKL